MATPAKACLQQLLDHIIGNPESTTVYLNNLKNAIADNKDVDSFTWSPPLQPEDDPNRPTTPITDIKIMFSKKDKEVPAGYQMLKKSVGGERPADLNKGGGGRHIFLAYKRQATVAADEKAPTPPASDPNVQKPLTSLSVVFTDTHEEPPYAFQVIEKTTTGQVADLNTGTQGRTIYLCTYRGDGAPLTDVSIIFRDKKAREVLPQGYHEVRLTPFGHKANLNSGSDGLPVYLCFKPDVTHVLQRYKPFAASATDNGPARALACLSAALFSFDQSTVLASTDAFKKLALGVELGGELVNVYIQNVCDATPCLFTYFNTNSHAYFLSFLSYLFQKFLAVLSTQSVLKLFEACMLARHEDKKVEASRSMLDYVISATERVKLCPCQKDKLRKREEQDEEDGYKQKGRRIEYSTQLTQCVQCQFSKSGATSSKTTTSDFCRAIVKSVVSQVDHSKMLELEQTKFMRHPTTAGDFKADITALLDLMFATEQVPKAQNPQERALYAMTLACCKFASEPSQFNLKKSEKVKRKVHGLQLLVHILQYAGFTFRGREVGVLLLRRFICPSLIAACTTDVPSVFRLVLQCFTTLYDNYLEHVMVEMGVLLDGVLLALLDSAYCTNEQKTDIIDVFMHIFKTPRTVIDLFYNFDNHISSWNIFERLITTLSKITEGDVAKYKGTASSSGAGTASAATPVVEEEPATLTLQTHGLKLLVHIMHHMAEWTGVPGLSRSKHALDAQHARMLKQKTLELDMESQRGRTETWSTRYDQQKEEKKIMEHALKLAKTEKLKAALKYLKMVNTAAQAPTVIAKFLYQTDCLDKSQVGDFLGSEYDNVMNTEEYKALRHSYLQLLDFTGSFDAGLRLFLCDSGFRLPGEAQKIDRLLEVFCKAFCRDNPGVFRNYSAAFVVSFALVMLNTDVHDPRLKSGNTSRKPMSVDEFVSNLRGIDDGHDFSRAFLEELYHNICANAIEWKEAKDEPKEPLAEAERVAEEEGTDLNGESAMEKLCRRNLELLIRKAQAQLKTQSSYLHKYNTTSSTHMVSAMFELTWFRFIAAITTRTENTNDVDIMHVCLDGLAYGATMAILFGLQMEHQAFSRVLAKITFIEKHRASKDKMDIPKKIVEGEHLSQDWFKPLNLMVEQHPDQACVVVLRVTNEIKSRISFERRQAVLRRIQSEFGGDLNLVDPDRWFVMQGKLTKVSSTHKDKSVEYTFFLFSDLIVYASEGMNTKYKLHRVVHLSLCRIVDIRSEKLQYAFKIVSPQKSFVVVAPSKKKKQQWLEAILSNLNTVMTQRLQVMHGVEKTASDKESKDSKDASPPPSPRPPPSPKLDDKPTSPAEKLSPKHVDSEKDTETQKLRAKQEQQSDKDSNSHLNLSSTSNLSGTTSSGNASPNGTPTKDSASLSSVVDGDVTDTAARRYSALMVDSDSGSGSGSGQLFAKKTKKQADTHCKLCIRSFAIFRRRQTCRWCKDVVCNDCCAHKSKLPNGDKRSRRVCDACYGVLEGIIGENVPLLSVTTDGEDLGDPTQPSNSKAGPISESTATASLLS